MSHWLALNVWPTTLHTVISGIVGAVVALLVVQPLRGAIKAVRNRLSAAIDSLDPDVPIGLTKQLDDMKDELEQLNTHVKGTIKVQPVQEPAANAVSHGSLGSHRV